MKKLEKEEEHDCHRQRYALGSQAKYLFIDQRVQPGQTK